MFSPSRSWFNVVQALTRWATETSVLSVSDCNDTADISVILTFLLLRLTVSVPPLSRYFRQLKKKKETVSL